MKEHRNLILYSTILILITGVNFAVYFLLCHFEINYLDANAGAWLVSVIMAYWAKRCITLDRKKEWLKEMLSFCSFHFPLLLIETFFLFIAVFWLKSSSVPAKILVTVISILKFCFTDRKRMFSKEAQQK